jgi:hypothetical protein
MAVLKEKSKREALMNVELHRRTKKVKKKLHHWSPLSKLWNMSQHVNKRVSWMAFY